MKKLAILSLVLVPISAAVAQGSGPTPAAPSTTTQSYDGNQTICRTVRDTGSRLARTRLCMTRAEWDQRRRDTRSNLERAQTVQVNKTAGQ